jgi:hypothetical protein
MDALPKDIQALLSKVLPKIFITIDALTSLRDVPTALEQIATRLTRLEYAMFVWRQAQSLNSQVNLRSLVSPNPTSHFSRADNSQTHLEDGGFSSLRHTFTSSS